jgi:hypothetical protein
MLSIPLLYFFLFVYLDKNLFHCEKVNCRARLFRMKVGLAIQYFLFFRFSVYVWIIKLELEDEASLKDQANIQKQLCYRLEPLIRCQGFGKQNDSVTVLDMCLLPYANLFQSRCTPGPSRLFVSMYSIHHKYSM